MTLAAVAALLLEDAAPRMVPARSHEVLAAFSLATIAVAYVIFQFVRRAGLAEMGKAILLAAAFLFWAANQYWPNLPQAGLFNDIAIGLFVLDVFLVISISSPAANGAALREGDWVSAGDEAGSCDCCKCGERRADGMRKRVSTMASEAGTAIGACSCGRQLE